MDLIAMRGVPGLKGSARHAHVLLGGMVVRVVELMRLMSGAAIPPTNTHDKSERHETKVTLAKVTGKGHWQRFMPKVTGQKSRHISHANSKGSALSPTPESTPPMLCTLSIAPSTQHHASKHQRPHAPTHAGDSSGRLFGPKRQHARGDVVGTGNRAKGECKGGLCLICDLSLSLRCVRLD